MTTDPEGFLCGEDDEEPLDYIVVDRLKRLMRDRRDLRAEVARLQARIAEIEAR